MTRASGCYAGGPFRWPWGRLAEMTGWSRRADAYSPARLFAMTDLREIVSRLGGSIFDNGNSARVPGPGHTRRDRSLSLKITSDGKLLFHSFSGDDLESVKAHLGIQPGIFQSVEYAPRLFRLAEVRAEQNRKRAFCKRVWGSASASQDTLAHTYLRARGIDIHTMPDCLRFSTAAPRGYETDKTAPAMLALITDAAGMACGVHATFLHESGARNTGRVMFGSSAGSVRLYPVRPTLAIAEGIETALSYSYRWSVCSWAALSTSGLTAWRAPDGCERVVVAADNDRNGAGFAAAEKLCAAHPEGVATIHMPEKIGTDWNDFITRT